MLRLEAIILFRVGNVAPEPCNRCSKQQGVFSTCVIATGYMSSACTNCYYTQARRCSFCESESNLIGLPKWELVKRVQWPKKRVFDLGINGGGDNNLAIGVVGKTTFGKPSLQIKAGIKIQKRRIKRAQHTADENFSLKIDEGSKAQQRPIQPVGKPKRSLSLKMSEKNDTNITKVRKIGAEEKYHILGDFCLAPPDCRDMAAERMERIRSLQSEFSKLDSRDLSRKCYVFVLRLKNAAINNLL